MIAERTDEPARAATARQWRNARPRLSRSATLLSGSPLIATTSRARLGLLAIGFALAWTCQRCDGPPKPQSAHVVSLPLGTIFADRLGPSIPLAHGAASGTPRCKQGVNEWRGFGCLDKAEDWSHADYGMNKLLGAAQRSGCMHRGPCVDAGIRKVHISSRAIETWYPALKVETLISKSMGSSAGIDRVGREWT